jgi:hypothetical protein
LAHFSAGCTAGAAAGGGGGAGVFGFGTCAQRALEVTKDAESNKKNANRRMTFPLREERLKLIQKQDRSHRATWEVLLAAEGPVGKPLAPRY